VDHGPAGVRQGYQGNPAFGTEITGAIHKGKIQPKNQEKLNKLMEIITESNNNYTKSITSNDALVNAGWKGGWQDIATEGSLRKAIKKQTAKINTTFQKMDNYVNNVMLAEDALVQDFRNPQKHLREKFGVSRGTVDNWAKESKVYNDNKKLFKGLGKELSFNKYKTLPDGTPRLISDYSTIVQNKLPTPSGAFKGDPATKFILESARRHFNYAKHAGKSPQIRFIGDPNLLPINEWKFIKNGKLYSTDASIGELIFEGKPYKNNFLNHVDAAKLYKNDFGEVYKMFDELDVYMNTEVINPKTGKPIKLDTLLRQQAFEKSKTIKNPEGKKDFLRRRFAEIDHADINKNPFSDLRLLDRTTNEKAGIIKRLDKYKNNPKLLNKTLTDIGYFNKDKNTAAFVNRLSKKAGVIPKFKIPSGGGTALHSFPANLSKMWKTLGSGGRKALGWATAGAVEYGFFKLDMINEMGKGKSKKEAAAIAAQNVTLGLYKNKEYMKELKKVAEDMGVDSRAFEKVYELNKMISEVDQQKQTYQQNIDMISKMPGDPERKAKALAGMKKTADEFDKLAKEQIAKNAEKVAGQISISKAGEVFPTPNLDQIAEARYDIKEEDFYRPFAEIQMVAGEKLFQEKKKAFPVFSKQVNIEAGPIGDPLLTHVFTLDAPGRKKEKKYIEDMLAFDPRELYRYNLYKRGISPDQPVSQQAWENLKYEHPGLGLAGGGLANLTRTVAPDSGPMSRGLSYLYNRVKKQ